MHPSKASLNWAGELDASLQRRYERICEIRRHLHRHPEPSGAEVKTTRYIASVLAAEHLEPVILPGSHGLWVDVGGEPGRGSDSGGRAASDLEVKRPRIAIRGDIDALWIQDEKRVDYRSAVDGVMHACGHDAHTTIVLAATLVLAELDRAGRLPWPIHCRAIFQPAEETNQGALQMIQGGAVDGIAELLGVHVDPSRAVNSIGVRHGDFTADCHELELEVHGSGGHAARPHEAVDPIAIAAQLIGAIYQFVPRINNSHDPVVLTFGQIHGGQLANVIPDQVVIRGTLRTLDAAVSAKTIEQIERLANGISAACGGRVVCRWLSGPPPVKNDSELVNLLTESGRAVVGEHNVQMIRHASMGGEDFANYLTRVRGAMFRLGCATVSPAPPLHSPLFDIDERALRIGAEILAHAVIRWCDPKGDTGGVTLPGANHRPSLH